MTAEFDVDDDGFRVRLAAVEARIAAAGGDPAAVDIVAVTKAKPTEAARLAARAGVASVGENYAQELLRKQDELLAEGIDTLQWHMIGRLQSNKIKSLAGRVALWQSIDRPSLVTELARRDAGGSVLIQLDISGEASKGGVGVDDLDDLVSMADAAGLRVRGLMGVASASTPSRVGEQFAVLRRHCDRLGLAVCSMGMSSDLEIAVKEGSTMVRVGSDLFGARPT
jgi:pyridoxal phosphate enzyme (YggS family)